MSIKLVVSDLDGTLLNKYSRLDRETIQVVSLLKEKGIKFTFATGRTDLNTWYYAKLLNLDLPIISCNGSLIRYPFSSETLYQSLLPVPAVNYLLEQFMRAQNDFVIYTPDAIYYPANSLTVKRFYYYNDLAAAIDVPTIKLINFTEWQKGRTNLCPELAVKMYCHAPNNKAASSLRELVNSFPELVAIKCAKEAIDIMHASSDKAEGVKRLAKLYGLTWSEIATFGDEDNDCKMIKAAQMGFLMKNANKSFSKRLDKAILAENHNCAGFARAVKQYLL